MSIEWDGKGLPPVGCECEIKRAIDWIRCKILFISDAHVVIYAPREGEPDEVCWHTLACLFRPIRTEAERRREAAVSDMREALGHAAGLIEVNNIYRAIAAGKVRGIRLTDDAGS